LQQEIAPASRTLLFFELADADDAGFFEVSLNPGQYSLLVRAGDALLWPDGALGADFVNPIIVPDQGVAELLIDIHSLLPL
jgi:hypothetical protein